MSRHFISGRRCFMAGAAAAALGVSGTVRAAEGGGRVVELFTSQGCSSCPPADALLGRLLQRPDVVALSMHVDYWNYIGWKDPFASPAMTERQRAYSRAFGLGHVYTPEMVVDGIGHAPGTSVGTIDSLLAEAGRRSPRRATPDIRRSGDGTVTVTLDAFDLQGASADVVLAVYDRRHRTAVARGENGGRTLDNFNVVRRLESLGRWDGGVFARQLPGVHVAPGQGLAVLVQRPANGPMLGCNKFEPA